MTKMERCRVAMEYHEKGFNCAQSVLEAFRDLIGLTKELLRRFTEQFNGQLDCRDLLQDKTLAKREEVVALGSEKHCNNMIISAVAILSDYLEELNEE